MGFISLYLKVLKEHYVDFKGRAGRAEFWTVFLINALVAWLLMWGFGFIWFIILCAKVGEEGQNRFGDPAPACDPTKNE